MLVLEVIVLFWWWWYCVVFGGLVVCCVGDFLSFVVFMGVMLVLVLVVFGSLWSWWC